MMNNIFHTENLSVGYNGKVVVDGIDITLERGKILTLIGPNGSGKTTILKSITKHIKALGGKVFVSGKDTAYMTGEEIAKQINKLKCLKS